MIYFRKHTLGIPWTTSHFARAVIKQMKNRRFSTVGRAHGLVRLDSLDQPVSIPDEQGQAFCLAGQFRCRTVGPLASYRRAFPCHLPMVKTWHEQSYVIRLNRINFLNSCNLKKNSRFSESTQNFCGSS